MAETRLTARLDRFLTEIRDPGLRYHGVRLAWKLIKEGDPPVAQEILDLEAKHEIYNVYTINALLDAVEYTKKHTTIDAAEGCTIDILQAIVFCCEAKQLARGLRDKEYARAFSSREFGLEEDLRIMWNDVLKHRLPKDGVIVHYVVSDGSVPSRSSDPYEIYRCIAMWYIPDAPKSWPAVYALHDDPDSAAPELQRIADRMWGKHRLSVYWKKA